MQVLRHASENQRFKSRQSQKFIYFQPLSFISRVKLSRFGPIRKKSRPMLTAVGWQPWANVNNKRAGFPTLYLNLKWKNGKRSRTKVEKLFQRKSTLCRKYDNNTVNVRNPNVSLEKPNTKMFRYRTFHFWTFRP